MRQFDTPTTRAMINFLNAEGPNGSGRVVGLEIGPDGVFIYTVSAEWCDDSGAGTFRADSETAAIRKFRERVTRGDGNVDYPQPEFITGRRAALAAEHRARVAAEEAALDGDIFPPEPAPLGFATAKSEDGSHYWTRDGWTQGATRADAMPITAARFSELCAMRPDSMFGLRWHPLEPAAPETESTAARKPGTRHGLGRFSGAVFAVPAPEPSTAPVQIEHVEHIESWRDSYSTRPHCLRIVTRECGTGWLYRGSPDGWRLVKICDSPAAAQAYALDMAARESEAEAEAEAVRRYSKPARARRIARAALWDAFRYGSGSGAPIRLARV